MDLFLRRAMTLAAAGVLIAIALRSWIGKDLASHFLLAVGVLFLVLPSAESKALLLIKLIPDTVVYKRGDPEGRAPLGF